MTCQITGAKIENNQEIAEALKHLRNRILGFSASNNVYRVIQEEILKYDPTFETHNSARLRRKHVADRNDLVQKLRTENEELRKEVEKWKYIANERLPRDL